MSLRPRALYGLLLPLGVAFAAACSSEDRSPRPPGAKEGTMAIYSATLDDGRNERQFFLRNGADEQRLFFDAEPEVTPGALVEVWGKDQDDGLHVAGMRIEHDVEEVTEQLVNGTPYTPRKFGLIFVDIGGGINITKDEALKRLVGMNPGDNSVKEYYLEASYKTQDITGDVYGPLSYAPTGCATSALASALKPQLPMFDHYLWYFGSRNASCGWSGLAEEGTPARPQNDTWYNASAGCVVLVQEPGHNFGMQHSSSMTCGSVPFVDTPQGTCTHNEYGDKYDPMGGGCNHMNAWQKVLEGWLQKCNAVKIKSTGTYTLLPIESQCDGAQVLQIPMPKVRPFTRSGGGGTATNEQLAYYYLELRTSRGFDTTIRSLPTVLVHVGEDFRTRTQQMSGRHTWILDMDPTSTRTIEGLTAGKGYTDPAGGVQFNVVSLSADSAQISVTIPNGSGAATCIDGTTQPDPPNTTCDGIVSVGGAGGMGGAGGAAGNAGTSNGGAGGAVTQPPRVEQLLLVNADTEMDMMEITEASTLNLDVLPPNLTARINTDPDVVGSVVVQIDGGMPRNENTPPYSVTPQPTATDFTPWTLGLGSHTITATPYTGPDATGTVGAPLTVTFTLSRASTGTGGSPPIGTGGFATGGFPTGTGGFATGTGGTALPMMASGGAFPGTSGFGGGAAAFGAGTAGVLSNDTGGSASASCGCRLTERPSSTGNKGLALTAVALGLALRRRRRS